MRQLKNINSAFILKWGWKILNDSGSLWSETMKEKYLKGNSLFDVVSTSPSSSLWKVILQKRAILKENICKRIGDGHSTSI